MVDEKGIGRKSRGGAPIGNRNAAKGGLLRGALRRELQRTIDGEKRILRVARALVDRAENGDVQAFREIADRIDGKAGILDDVDSGGLQVVVMRLSAGGQTLEHISASAPLTALMQGHVVNRAIAAPELLEAPVDGDNTTR